MCCMIEVIMQADGGAVENEVGNGIVPEVVLAVGY